MSIDGIRRALQSARVDGKVDLQEVDRIMLQARDRGGIDDGEKSLLMKEVSSFDDATAQRVLSHLSATSQKNAWVNIETDGAVASIKGRYANVAVGVKGLSAKEGLFDNCFSLKGKAAAAGKVTLNIEGTPISLQVKKGETAAQILERVKQKLPSAVAGVVLGGDVQPWEAPSFNGPAARSSDRAAHLMLYKPEALGLKPGEKPLRVVVTGYGAFMGITNNPSSVMAQKLGELGVKGGIIDYRRLDVTTDAVDTFLKELKSNPPDVVLSMGVSPGQAQVEEKPNNYVDANEDGNGNMITPREIVKGAPAELPTDLPVETIDWALQSFGAQREVFTSKSDANYQPDRSAYLCNYLGFSLAQAFGTKPETTAGFMHINRNTPVDQMHSVLEALTSRQLEVRRGTTPPKS